MLRELLGHATPETTADYVHLSIEHLAAEGGGLDAWMTRLLPARLTDLRRIRTAEHDSPFNALAELRKRGRG